MASLLFDDLLLLVLPDPPRNKTVEARNSNPDGAPKDYELQAAPSVAERTSSNTRTAAVIEERARSKCYPEIHIIVDMAFAKGYAGSKPKILSYLATQMNAVNLRYKGFTSPAVSLRIVGVTINNSPSQESYYKRLPGHRNMIKPHETVVGLASYIKNKAEYKNADLVFLYTGLDLADYPEWDGTAGYTMLGGVCNEYKTGAAEDEAGSYSGVYITAHEVAHGLGVVHDGDGSDSYIKGHPGAYSCPGGDGYIMGDFSWEKNHYLFSQCSINQFRHVYQMEKYSCLHKKNSKVKPISSANLAGDFVSYDDQCKAMKKERKYVYDKQKGVTDCQVNCITKKDASGWTYYGTVEALDGTPCDIKRKDMRCINNNCVYATKFLTEIRKRNKKLKKT